jgi:hypothetical protein
MEAVCAATQHYNPEDQHRKNEVSLYHCKTGHRTNKKCEIYSRKEEKVTATETSSDIKMIDSDAA